MITLLLPAQLLLCIHLSTWYSMSAPSLHSRTLPQKARGAERGGWGRERLVYGRCLWRVRRGARGRAYVRSMGSTVQDAGTCGGRGGDSAPANGEVCGAEVKRRKTTQGRREDMASPTVAIEKRTHAPDAWVTIPRTWGAG